MADPLQDPVVALHRYFIWSNEMMRLFKKALLEAPSGTKDLWGSEDFIRVHMYMSLWYGALWAVVEGWTALNLTDHTIDTLLAVTTGRMKKESGKGGLVQEVPETYGDLLRRVRNAVFHFQSNYFDRRWAEFVSQPNAAAWVQALQAAFDRWFVEWLRAREATPA